MVDDEDYEKLSKYKWYAKKSRYCTYVARSQRVGKVVMTIRMHREIMACPKGMEVDHLNGDTFNNLRDNLEIVTKAENIRREMKRKQ